MSELHEEVLAAPTAGICECLGTQAELGVFYLAGGTGAALQLGHRISEDLDLFTERPWSWVRLSHSVGACGAVSVDRQGEGSFVGSIDGVRVSLSEYPYVLLEEPIPTRFGIPVAGLTDIGCMKLIAAAQRGSRKDFVDLFYIGHAGYDIRTLMRALERKLPTVAYNPVHILNSLAYFEDAELEPDPIMLVPYEWRAVREYCAKQAEALLDDILG
ncbi:MAG: nucleotidyl transferase AbiEii/AbiGii toxin family protein [Actinomycetota bacterium]|nr:nucleotidyl transferase AbiEii/AbiGii toxin family protein [Actinomycetota bacterium]